MIAMSLFALGSGPAQAHEVRPTVADFSVSGNTLILDMRVNAEAFLAGIDLDGLDDTNNDSQSAVYDELRYLDPQSLETRFRAFAEKWKDQIGVSVSGPVELHIKDLRIGPFGDPRAPRDSFLVFEGRIPPLAQSMTFSWPKGSGSLILRQQGVEEPFADYLSGGETTQPIPLDGGVQTSAFSVFAHYIPVGFDHIVPKGLDHILFVLGLFFLGTAWRTLLWQVSAFTLAHTVTLAFGALGWVQAPPSIVEPLIAASITYVAVENIWVGRLTRWRPVVIFMFGLLHGLGFASVLGEFGLPRAQFFPALIGFNVGVEFGQLAVIAVAFLTVGYWFGQKEWYRSRIAVPASAVIALIGAYWFVERVFL